MSSCEAGFVVNVGLNSSLNLSYVINVESIGLIILLLNSGFEFEYSQEKYYKYVLVIK